MSSNSIKITRFYGGDNAEMNAKKDYMASLSDLKGNSKPLINTLSIVAGENRKFAKTLTETIDQHLMKAVPACKLPCLYLVDSIIKNVGAPYIEHMSKCIVRMFVNTFSEGDEAVRKSLFKLRLTWKDLFPVKKLRDLDACIHDIDPNWPKIHETEPSASTVHINPNFLQRPAATPTAPSTLIVDSEWEKIRKEKAALEKAQRELEEKQKQFERKQLQKQLQMQKERLLTEKSGDKKLGSIVKGVASSDVTSPIKQKRKLDKAPKHDEMQPPSVSKPATKRTARKSIQSNSPAALSAKINKVGRIPKLSEQQKKPEDKKRGRQSDSDGSETDKQTAKRVYPLRNKGDEQQDPRNTAHDSGSDMEVDSDNETPKRPQPVPSHPVPPHPNIPVRPPPPSDYLRSNKVIEQVQHVPSPEKHYVRPPPPIAAIPPRPHVPTPPRPPAPGPLPVRPPAPVVRPPAPSPTIPRLDKEANKGKIKIIAPLRLPGESEDVRQPSADPRGYGRGSRSPERHYRERPSDDRRDLPQRAGDDRRDLPQRATEDRRDVGNCRRDEQSRPSWNNANNRGSRDNSQNRRATPPQNRRATPPLSSARDRTTPPPSDRKYYGVRLGEVSAVPQGDLPEIVMFDKDRGGAGSGNEDTRSNPTNNYTIDRNPVRREEPGYEDWRGSGRGGGRGGRGGGGGNIPLKPDNLPHRYLVKGEYTAAQFNKLFRVAQSDYDSGKIEEAEFQALKDDIRYYFPTFRFTPWHRGGYRGGPHRRGGYESGRGGYESGRGGYESGRGGYEPNPPGVTGPPPPINLPGPRPTLPTIKIAKPVETVKPLDPASLFDQLLKTGLVVKNPPFKLSCEYIMNLNKEVLIDELYTGLPCTNCGKRFDEEEAKTRHIHYDWHFKKNSQSEAGQISRTWYMTTEDWTSSTSHPGTFDNPSTVQISDEQWTQPLDDDFCGLKKCLLNSTDENYCHVCHDILQQEYNQKDDDWFFINAQRRPEDDKVCHVHCMQEGLDEGNVSAGLEVTMNSSVIDNVDISARSRSESQDLSSDVVTPTILVPVLTPKPVIPVISNEVQIDKEKEAAMLALLQKAKTALVGNKAEKTVEKVEEVVVKKEEEPESEIIPEVKTEVMETETRVEPAEPPTAVVQPVAEPNTKPDLDLDIQKEVEEAIFALK